MALVHNSDTNQQYNRYPDCYTIVYYYSNYELLASRIWQIILTRYISHAENREAD